MLNKIMKKKRWIILLIVSVIVLTAIGIITFNILNDSTKLTSEERTWINDNINNVQNVYVIKDENLFSKDGTGVFYEFLNSFSEEYGIKLNVISIDKNTKENGNNFIVEKNISDSSKLFYKDHYVLVGKNKEFYYSNNALNGKTVGVYNDDLEYIKNYLKENSINYIGYNDKSELFNALSDKGYDVQVSFDNGESTSAVLLGQQGGQAVITITNTNQPLRVFASGNFEVTDDNIKTLQDIQQEIEVL